MNLQLENKFALVTGSTAGIGFAIAKALAAEGARVIVNGRSETRVTEAIAAIRAHIPSARLEALALDLSKADHRLAKEKHASPNQVEQQFFQTARPSSLLQRFATPDEVAALVAFVASPLSSAINGAALRVEGGVVRSIL